jgi:hypothetical protein
MGEKAGHPFRGNQFTSSGGKHAANRGGKGAWLNQKIADHNAGVRKSEAGKTPLKELDKKIYQGTAWQRGEALEEARSRGLKLNKSTSGLAIVDQARANSIRRATADLSKGGLPAKEITGNLVKGQIEARKAKAQLLRDARNPERNDGARLSGSQAGQDLAQRMRGRHLYQDTQNAEVGGDTKYLRAKTSLVQKGLKPSAMSTQLVRGEMRQRFDEAVELRRNRGARNSMSAPVRTQAQVQAQVANDRAGMRAAEMKGAAKAAAKEKLEMKKLAKGYKKTAQEIEAYGVKGGQSKDWRKTFKNREELNKWADKNDAETRATRPTEAGYAAKVWRKQRADFLRQQRKSKRG